MLSKNRYKIDNINHNGTLISVYGYRCKPYGIRVMFSRDEGETWDVDNVILDQKRGNYGIEGIGKSKQ